MSTHQPWGRRWALALLPAAVSAAFAQGAPQAAPGEEDAPTLETVQVRSMRNAARYGYATPIIETPQSVSVVTGRHLDEREPQDIAETLAYTSGVQGGCRGENGVIEMSVRGIGVKNEGGGQGSYWNGLPYRPSLKFSPYALERVEVLKGPPRCSTGRPTPAASSIW
ncbi:TonB-dependent receptor plug domain-containing protein [uncultured Ottowia sp.]|uniref:TonB-dependent receptor plug domain-containing protein n=1 Tax=uncultured Ottowia sp. TaxID=543067 RepID=UPI0025970338|nr:TonB-dependent receptor plug domain-containing protein [uncultured Ottowia sp.]